MKSKQSGRRQFLKNGAALAGLAAGGLRIASGEVTLQPDVIRPTGLRPTGEQSHFEKLTRTGTATQGYTPLSDLQGIITPSNLHFYVNHEKGVLMNIDPAQHRLTVYGMVDHPLVLTLDEVKQLPSVSRIHFLECNANSSPKVLTKAKTVVEGHGLTSCSEWTGVLLSLLLKEAGVKKGADWLLVGSALPPPGFYGNAGRNIMTGPGFVNFDLSLFKSTPLSIREGSRLEFRAEVFNLFNRANFGIPSSLQVLNGSARAYIAGAGKITSTVGSSRQLQFGLKLVF